MQSRRSCLPTRLLTVLAALAALLPLALGTAIRASAASPGNDGWQPRTPPLTTPWTSQVGPDNALPDYPRPQSPGRANAGTYTLCVNGKPQAKVLNQCLGDPSSGPLAIGRGFYNGSKTDFFPGTIDQVHVWNRALSAADVAQLYQSGQ